MLNNEMSQKSEHSFLLKDAYEYGFDPLGYRRNIPLNREIFHRDPYITCSHCNYLNFVDISAIRRMIHLPKNINDSLDLPVESLPPCKKCGRADSFVIGSHDFTKEIEERKRIEEERLKVQASASILIQKAYRKHLVRMYGSALSSAFLADNLYKHKAALKLTSIARGRLARRVAKTERSLLIIKYSHPLLIRNSLKLVPKKPKTFWYKRKVELDLLYKNYLELVEKTGYQPARKVVEENIWEISRRIIYRKTELIVLLQKRWRGYMARRIVKYFRTEISRIFQMSVSRVMKIQTVYRGHRARLLILKLKQQAHREKVMQKYLGRGRDDSLLKQKQVISERVLNTYKKERQEEKTSRYTSKIPPPAEYGMNKMKAFWDSCYADDLLAESEKSLLDIDKRISTVEMNKNLLENARKSFINEKIAEYGPNGYGLRSESRPEFSKIRAQIPIKNINVSHKAENEGVDELFAEIHQLDQNIASRKEHISPSRDSLKKESKRSQYMRKYYQSELIDINMQIVERMQHDYRKKSHLSLFKAYNDSRQQKEEDKKNRLHKNKKFHR